MIVGSSDSGYCPLLWTMGFVNIVSKAGPLSVAVDADAPLSTELLPFVAS